MTNENQFSYECSCCGSPLKHPYYFEGKIYGSTCIGLVSGAIPYISLMKQYNVNSVEEALELQAQAIAKGEKERLENEVRQQSRVVKGKENGLIYDLITEYINYLEPTGEPTSYLINWKWTLEEKSINDMNDKQQEGLTNLYADIMKHFKGSDKKKDELKEDFGVMYLGWERYEDSDHYKATLKLKKMKFDKVQELAIKLNIPEATDYTSKEKRYLVAELLEVEGIEEYVL